VRYTVDVLGESIQVDVRDGPTGLEVAVGDGSHEPAQLTPSPAPLHILEHGDDRQRITVAEAAHEPGTYLVALEGRRPVSVVPVDELSRATASSRGSNGGGGAGPKLMRAAMPGVVVELRVEVGQAVAKGQVVLILEAMKMQNEICARGECVVKTLHVTAGEAVKAGAKLVEFGE
jgi:glutaconyl-CoA/methylmalonyl-CoA decarboxylase subunit gamma